MLSSDGARQPNLAWSGWWLSGPTARPGPAARNSRYSLPAARTGEQLVLDACRVLEGSQGFILGPQRFVFIPHLFENIFENFNFLTLKWPKKTAQSKQPKTSKKLNICWPKIAKMSKTFGNLCIRNKKAGPSAKLFQIRNFTQQKSKRKNTKKCVHHLARNGLRIGDSG